MDGAANGGTKATLNDALARAVKVCRVLELLGHGDRIWGHVAMRDPGGRGFWLKRNGISLGEVYDAGDFQLCGWDGEVIEGAGHRHAEWPIHGEIFAARPDINYTAHTHPFYGSVFSAISEPLFLVRGSAAEPPPCWEGSSDLVVTKEQGADLARALGAHNAVFMRNHGVVFCGSGAVEMLKTGEELEEACRQTLTVNASGFRWGWADEEEQGRKAANFKALGSDEPLWDYYCRLLARAEAGGDPRLSSAPVENR